jgi:hypothetical protein
MQDLLLENLPPNIQHEISQQIYGGYKINAIKLYRNAVGCDLFTAKQAIEQIEKDLKAKNPYPFNNKTSSPNTDLPVIAIIILVGLVLAGLAALSPPHWKKIGIPTLPAFTQKSQHS